jgi:hypothetical protein
MTIKTKATLATDITTVLADNTTGAITPSVMRTLLQNHLDSLQSVGLVYDGLGPTGCVGQNMPRNLTMSNQGALTAGTLKMHAVWLPALTTVTTVNFQSGTQAAVAPTNWWMGLYDSALLGLRLTADQTSTAWAATTVKSVNLTSTFTTTYSGLHYVGLMVAAGTAPSLNGVTGLANGPLTLAPIMNGHSTAGLTGIPTPGTAGGVGGTAGALTASAGVGYAWLT